MSEEKVYDLRDPDVQAACRARLTSEPNAAVDPAPVAAQCVGKPAWAEPGAKGERGPAEKHPWRVTLVNGTFRIAAGPGQPKFSTVAASCSRKGKLLGRKYRAHRYPDGTIEVWRES